MTYRAKIRVVAVCALALVQTACRTAAPVVIGPHIPEPTAPFMTPVVVPAPTARSIVQQLADSAFAAPMWSNARWGVLIVDVASGDTIVAHDADKLFMPASNQKLLTAAIALQQLGPEYRWHTPVLLRGVQHGKTWHGDVLVVGSGDPSVSDSLRSGHANAAFAPITAALAKRGITRIVGDVRTLGDAFTGATTGFGWAVDDGDEAYGAAIDELLLNDGLLTLRVTAGTTLGSTVRVQRAPTAAYPPLVIRATTRGSGAVGERLRANYDSTTTTIEVTGTLPLGDSAKLSLAYRHPNDAYRAALRETIVTSGVRMTLASPTILARERLHGTIIDTLIVLESPPLRDVLPRMQKPSQNQIAELLFRTAGRVGSNDGSADSARAVGARTLALFGVTNADVAYRDGSGLSRHDYVTPRAIIRVLDSMRRSPWFSIYRDALPLAGVDGTIANRMKGTAAAGNAHAKTGTVDKARSLSGYVTTADGHLVLFSMLCNNFTAANREVERVQDLLVSTLAALRIVDVIGTRDR